MRPSAVDRIVLKRRMAERIPQSELLNVRLITEEALDSYFVNAVTDHDKRELKLALTMSLALDSLIDKCANKATIKVALDSLDGLDLESRTNISNAVALYHQQLSVATRGQFEHACQIITHLYRKENVSLHF